MKKILFLLTALILGLVQANAQRSLMATLSHEGNLTTYYGVWAFHDAYGYAQDGDIVTLSAGTFRSPQNAGVKNNVIIYGAGCEDCPEEGRYATHVIDNQNVIPGSTVTFEGIDFQKVLRMSGDNNDVTINKCLLGGIEVNGEGANKILIKNSKINQLVIYSRDLSSTTMDCINSIILKPYNYHGASNGNINLYHCFVEANDKTGGWTYMNSIIFATYWMPAYCANNCILLKTSDDNIFGTILKGENNYKFDYNESLGLFKTYTENIFENTFELSEDAKTQYLGDDGTEIGIFGGDLPYSLRPMGPQITRFNVANRSTSDGKLSIDITVSMPE